MIDGREVDRPRIVTASELIPWIARVAPDARQLIALAARTTPQPTSVSTVSLPNNGAL